MEMKIHTTRLGDTFKYVSVTGHIITLQNSVTGDFIQFTVDELKILQQFLKEKAVI